MHPTCPAALRTLAQSRSTNQSLVCAVVAGLLIAAWVLLVPAPARGEVVAAAITAPSLESPIGGFSAVEGSSLTITWSGALQGDPSAIARSYFQLELAHTDDVPAGTQTAWTTLENSRQTPPGETVQTLTIGVPTSGSYKWRVCAWGVVDAAADNAIQQLPGGCSITRTLVTKPAVVADASVGVVEQQNKVQVAQPVKVIRKTRPAVAAPAVAEPVAETPVPEVAAPIAAPPTFTQIVGGQMDTASKESAVSLPRSVKVDTASEHSGVGGAISAGLTATIPGIPIPFWTLVLLAGAIPLARTWRRNVLDMFEWDDGTTNGSGNPAFALQIVADDTSFKASPPAADTRATSVSEERAA
jgi:hypothetical protein